MSTLEQAIKQEQWELVALLARVGPAANLGGGGAGHSAGDPGTARGAA